MILCLQLVKCGWFLKTFWHVPKFAPVNPSENWFEQPQFSHMQVSLGVVKEQKTLVAKSGQSAFYSGWSFHATETVIVLFNLRPKTFLLYSSMVPFNLALTIIFWW